jgi:acyl-homoserine-lactone acylase
MLAINPHQPVTGPFSWYEAHLVSEEGLNIHGAMFPGGTSIFLGNNEHLGWAHTFNHLDLIDVFKLSIDPNKKHHFMLNGESFPLEKRNVKLRVKLKPWLPVIGVKKTTFWCKFGPVLESDDGHFYLIKMSAIERIRAGEQWYRMNRATNFTEFYDAIALGQTTMFNIVYADRYDTIMYINNAVMPKRNPEFNYRKVIGLTTDAPLWTDFHPVEDLVQYVNPSCGYVFNTNNLPTNATCESEQRDISEWPDYFGFDKDLGDNNRAFRFMELIALPGRMTFDRMKEIKYDWESKTCTRMFESIEHLLYMDMSAHPALVPLQEKIILWDGCADKSSEGAGTFLLTFQYLFEALGYNDSDFKQSIVVSEADYIAALERTHDHLERHFGGRIVPLGELQRHVRGEVNLPLGGYPDALSANYNEPWEDGRFKPFVGDSYTHFVHWIPGKPLPYMETLHPFGASNRADSPHYTDQMKRYARQDPKEMTLDHEAIRANATKIYAPGSSKN